jgi:(1->4)-alpha-D-glucan 1-alpha-D-glucosylmutase
VLDDPNEDYLLWQTLVGAWPVEQERIVGYMEKALRERKRTTSWIDPNMAHENRVRRAIARIYEQLPVGFVQFAEKVADRGRDISLGQTLLKLTCPGVPDIYQGDEHETLSLVDPDNRRRAGRCRGSTTCRSRSRATTRRRCGRRSTPSTDTRRSSTRP